MRNADGPSLSLGFKLHRPQEHQVLSPIQFLRDTVDHIQHHRLLGQRYNPLCCKIREAWEYIGFKSQWHTAGHQCSADCHISSFQLLLLKQVGGVLCGRMPLAFSPLS